MWYSRAVILRAYEVKYVKPAISDFSIAGDDIE